jgi:signal transduction histidine kinase
MPSWVTPLLAIVVLIELIALGVGYLRWQHWRSEAERQLKRMQAERNAARQQLDLLARIIHDLGSPIHGLWGVSHLVACAGLSDGYQRMELQLEHLHSLVDILQLRIAGGIPELHCQRLPAVPIVLAAVDAANTRITAPQPVVSVQQPATSTMVWADATALRRVLDNLITNALDATNSRGPVVVELWNEPRRPDTLTISVLNRGGELTEEQRQRMFEPYTRFRTSAGMGLGLAIVKELVEQMGGICAVNTPGGTHTRVWVCLRTRADVVM